MNSVLARIYGHEKTASDNSELDLTQISAADLLAGLEDGSIVMPEGEKTAGDGEVDLSQISGAQLLEMLEQVEAEESGEVIEKMAADGSLDYFDTAGRIMAHAHADELAKMAGDEDIDLSEISGEQLVALIESGEYEIEKDASAMEAVAGKGLRLMGKREAALRRLPGKVWGGVRGGARRYGELASAKHTRANVGELAGADAAKMDKVKAYLRILRGGKAGPNAVMTSEARKSLGTQAATLAGGGGIAGGVGYKLTRKKGKR